MVLRVLMSFNCDFKPETKGLRNQTVGIHDDAMLDACGACTIGLHSVDLPRTDMCQMVVGGQHMAHFWFLEVSQDAAATETPTESHKIFVRNAKNGDAHRTSLNSVSSENLKQPGYSEIKTKQWHQSTIFKQSIVFQSTSSKQQPPTCLLPRRLVPKYNGSRNKDKLRRRWKSYTHPATTALAKVFSILTSESCSRMARSICLGSSAYVQRWTEKVQSICMTQTP